MAYGADLGSKFGLDSARTVICNAKGGSTMAITELRQTEADSGAVVSIGPENALLLMCHLERTGCSIRGTTLGCFNIAPGQMMSLDLRTPVSFELVGRYHILALYIPLAIFELIEQGGMRGARSQFIAVERTLCDDQTIENLARCLLAETEPPQPVAQRLLESVFMAAAAYALHSGVIKLREARPDGSLTLWQEQLAKHLILRNLDTRMTVRDLASQCGVSASHFSRAFRKSSGKSPYQWLLALRIERARLLLESEAGIAEIALTCGFADQSHFTRVFTKIVGMSPGAWRRGTNSR
jgi:AraC family transcriptional regulator